MSSSSLRTAGSTWGYLSGYHGEKGMKNSMENLGVVGAGVGVIPRAAISVEKLFRGISFNSPSCAFSGSQESFEVRGGIGFSTYQQP